MVAGILLNARCLIGQDSGLAHLAGVLNVPALVLCELAVGRGVHGQYQRSRLLPMTTPPREVVREALNPSVSTGPAALPMDERDARSHTLLDEVRFAALQRAVRETAHLPGAMAELGSYRGGSALGMCLAAPGKLLHLFDALGLPSDDIEGGAHGKGNFAGTEADIRGLLVEQNVDFNFGTFPGTTAGLEEKRYACVHIDADLYQSTVDALAYFWPRMLPGGIMVFDDVDWPHCPGVNRALAEAGLLDRVERTAPIQGMIRCNQ